MFHEGLSRSTAGLALDREEAAHVRSLRLREGDAIEVTDGKGLRRAGRITAADRRGVEIGLGEIVPAPEPTPIDLLAPVGNRDRSLWLVEKGVELGVASIRFVEFGRSRSVSDGGRSDGFLEKARRRAVAALKQCGGARLPALEVVSDLPRALSSAGSASSRWIADPAGIPIADAAESLETEGRLALLVGPEGGLASAEVEAAIGSGFVAVSMGPSTLRFETAAIVGVALAAMALHRRKAREPVEASPDTFESRTDG